MVFAFRFPCFSQSFTVNLLCVHAHVCCCVCLILSSYNTFAQELLRREKQMDHALVELQLYAQFMRASLRMKGAQVCAWSLCYD